MSNQLGTIAILGSGETSPNLVAVHRKLLQEIPKPVKAYMLDSPFGFQAVSYTHLTLPTTPYV